MSHFINSSGAKSRILRFMEINGKVVVVAGAGGNGSGRAIARRFAADGAAVAITDIQVVGQFELLKNTLMLTGGLRFAHA